MCKKMKKKKRKKEEKMKEKKKIMKIRENRYTRLPVWLQRKRASERWATIIIDHDLITCSMRHERSQEMRGERAESLRMRSYGETWSYKLVHLVLRKQAHGRR